MVEDTITDGKRIAQLLASEITGLEISPLDGLSVVDANPDTMPTDAGTEAYSLVADGTTVAVVSMFPEYVTVSFETGQSWPAEEPRPELLAETDEKLVVASGGQVKRAVDAVSVYLEATDTADS